MRLLKIGENPYVKLKQQKDGSTIWTLPYTKKSHELNNPFYEKLLPVSIIRIMQFVNERIQFMQEVTHIKPHYAKSQLDEMAIYACLLANGTNLGFIKMSNLCDLNFTSLQTTERNYLRPDILHASLDRQKFVTERDNLLARYSQKYYGFDQGVVAYSMIANHNPINTMIIGANEHESRFLFNLQQHL